MIDSCLTNSNLYSETENMGNHYREQQYGEFMELISDMRNKAEKERSEYFRPDFSTKEAYISDCEKYRNDLKNMLGWPLNFSGLNLPKEEPEYIYIAEDDLGTIYRVLFPVLNQLHTYGLLFIPKGNGPFPLVISQHGGQGTPELTANFFGSENYNNMTRRILKRGAAVFAPQLLLWNTERFGPEFDRPKMDIQLKQLGSSITAVEIFKIQRSLDYLLRREDIDANHVGMFGLSYGGFYTIFTTAVDTRIRVAVSSCFVNDRFLYDWFDWTWFNAGKSFLDGEVCSLICPRPLYIEAGNNDELFTPEGFIKESEKIKDNYEKLGIRDLFMSKVFEGVHELNPQDAPLDFLFRYL